MFAYLETAYERINSLIDYMGYLLMLSLSLLLWWGIYTGVETTVSESKLLANSTPMLQDTLIGQDALTEDQSTQAARIAPPAVPTDYDPDNTQSLASGL